MCVRACVLRVRLDTCVDSETKESKFLWGESHKSPHKSPD